MDARKVLLPLPLLVTAHLLVLCSRAHSFQLMANLRQSIDSAGSMSRHVLRPGSHSNSVGSAGGLAKNADPTWQNFKEWAEARCMHFEKWHTGDIGDGVRGAVATEEVQEGDLLVSAPPESVLTVREADSCPLPQSFIDPDYWESMAQKWEMRMALLLLYEKKLGSQSTWAPYIEALPKELGLPLTFSIEELHELQFPALIEEVRAEREFWHKQFLILQNAMPNPPSEQELVWAISCVHSRAFTCDYGGRMPSAHVMFPGADMLNHDSSAGTAFRFHHEKNRFELFAPRATAKGHEIVHAYGTPTSEHLH